MIYSRFKLRLVKRISTNSRLQGEGVEHLTNSNSLLLLALTSEMERRSGWRTRPPEKSLESRGMSHRSFPLLRVLIPPACCYCSSVSWALLEHESRTQPNTVRLRSTTINIILVSIIQSIYDKGWTNPNLNLTFLQ